MNKKKKKGVLKYLIRWKGFIVENNSWEKEKNIKNTKKLVEEFEGKIKIKKQEKLELVKEKDFRRAELPGKYTVKFLYKWKDGKFKDEYLRKLERNWTRWKEKNKKIEKIV